MLCRYQILLCVDVWSFVCLGSQRQHITKYWQRATARQFIIECGGAIIISICCGCVDNSRTHFTVSHTWWFDRKWSIVDMFTSSAGSIPTLFVSTNASSYNQTTIQFHFSQPSVHPFHVIVTEKYVRPWVHRMNIRKRTIITWHSYNSQLVQPS